MRSGHAASLSPTRPRGSRNPHCPRRENDSPVEAEAPRKPPTARWRGRAERGSGRGTSALPSPNHPALLVPPAPDPGDASANQEFEGKPTRVTSGAGGGLGDSGARGATPRERGRRTACARRTRTGRGRRRRGGAGAPAHSASPPSLPAGWRVGVIMT